MFVITVKGENFVDFACETDERTEREKKLVDYLKSLGISDDELSLILEDYVDEISKEIATQALAAGFILGQAAKDCAADVKFSIK